MYGDPNRHPDEDEGFDDHYFRRRPKSVCMSANTADGRRFIPPTYGGLPPSASAHLPPHTLGIPTEPPNGATSGAYPPHATTSQPLPSDEQHRLTMVRIILIYIYFSRLSPFCTVLSGTRNGQKLRSLICSNQPSTQN